MSIYSIRNRNLFTNKIIIVFIVFLLFFTFCSADAVDPTDEADVIGVRIDTSEAVVGFGTSGYTTVIPNMDVDVRLFGQNFDEVETIFVTQSIDECVDYIVPIIPRESLVVLSKNTLKFTFNFPFELSSYYFCFNWVVKQSLNDSKSSNRLIETVHQGSKGWQYVMTTVRSTPPSKPVRIYIMWMPLQIVVIILLLTLSGLFSGLNFGLMSLDKIELEIILKMDEKREREYAEKIYPVLRRKRNFALCSLVLSNVIATSAILLFYDDLTSGLLALIVISLGLVIFGQMIPQAIILKLF